MSIQKYHPYPNIVPRLDVPENTNLENVGDLLNNYKILSEDVEREFTMQLSPNILNHHITLTNFFISYKVFLKKEFTIKFKEFLDKYLNEEQPHEWAQITQFIRSSQNVHLDIFYDFFCRIDKIVEYNKENDTIISVLYRFKFGYKKIYKKQVSYKIAIEIWLPCTNVVKKMFNDALKHK